MKQSVKQPIPEYDYDYREAMGDAVASTKGPPRSVNPHQLAAHGFAQSMGLHPISAVGLVTVDVAVQSAVVVTAGLLLPLSLVSGVVLGFVIYILQKKLYGDEPSVALAKACLCGLVSAIPSPLPYAVFLPMGVIGLFRRGK